MKGSGVASSKPSIRKSDKNQQVELLPQPLLPVGFEPDTTFEQYLELPINVREKIMSQGLKESSMRPGKQLQFALQVTPGLAIDKNFLLPNKVIVYFLNGTVETKTFNRFIEYKNYFEEVIKNVEENKFDIIDIINNDIVIRIQMFKESTSGSIHINIFSSSTRSALAQLTLNIERVKKQYDIVMISKVLLTVYINKETDIDTLKDIFVGIRWLSLLFKKISWKKDIVSFTHPDNVNAYYRGVKQTFTDIQPEIGAKLLLLLKYIELNLKPKKLSKLN